MHNRAEVTRTSFLRGTCFVLLSFNCGTATAQSLSDSPIVFSGGGWSVHRRQDPMTDANLCTALYRDNSGIQLGSHSLTVAVADGVKSVTLRYDNAAPHPTRVAKRSERAVGAVNIEGADFDLLLHSARLRYRVLTDSDNVVEGDVDLAGALDAYRNIQAGCLGEPL